MITIYVIEDNLCTRKGLCYCLNTQTGLLVVGEASSWNMARDYLKSNRPDIILLDGCLHDVEMNESIRLILLNQANARVLVLANDLALKMQFQALRAGAKGYLVHGYFSLEELIQTIREIMAVMKILKPSIDPTLFKNAGKDKTEMDIARDISVTTSRENEILGLVANGRSNKEIAKILNVEEKTVKNHINRIYSKLLIKNRYEAIKFML